MALSPAPNARFKHRSLLIAVCRKNGCMGKVEEQRQDLDPGLNDSKTHCSIVNKTVILIPNMK